MLDTGLPLENGEKDQACSVQPLSSHHASRSSTPGISSLDGTPRYLCFPPSSPTLPSPGSVSPPPPPPEMALKAACLFQPITEVQHDDRPPQEHSSTGMTAPPLLMPRPQRSIQMLSTAQTIQPAEETNYVTPLSEISHLLRLQKYHKRRAIQAQENLHYLQIAAAKTARLSRAAHSVQHTLAECLKSEDKNSFVNLLHAFQDACEDAFRPTSSTLQEAIPGSAGELRPTSSFLDSLSASSRATIIDFLSKVRYDGSFMADRLASLSHKELVGLLPHRNITRSSDSIFGTASRSISRTSRPLGFVVDAQVDLLSSYAYGSPLETLVFASSGFSQRNTIEEPLITDVWATVCARLVSDQKPGSERLIPNVLDIWSTLMPWPGKDRIEAWILQTLQQGAFLLEQPSKQTFRARVEGRSEVTPEDEARAEAFYVRAADSLLDLFGDLSIPSALPPGALRLCHAIFDKLRGSTGHQRAFPHFIMTRWLFSSFVMDLVALPEAYGLLTDHYVSEIARQRILREAAARAQKAVFDVAYSWKHGNAIPSETVNRVNAIMSRFQGSLSGGLGATIASHSSKKGASCFMAVSIKDVTTALFALYPLRRPASVSSDFDNPKSGLQSSSSSISGFSLFRHEKAFEPIQLTTSISQDVQSLSIADTDTLVQDLDESHSDEHTVREASLELEEFATSRVTSTREFWEVFELHVDSQILTPMREKYSEIQSRKQHKDHATASAVSPDVLSYAKTIEVLLYKYYSDVEGTSKQATEAWKELEGLFEQAIEDSQGRSDFVTAHRWFQQRQDIYGHISQLSGLGALCDIIDHVKLVAQKSIDQSMEIENTCEKWAASTQPQQALRNSSIKPTLDTSERLRDKMWYVADVRTSAAYDEARSIASALRIMGKSKRQARPRLSPPLRHWSASKVSSTSLHLKTEAQILDILSAKPEHGGSNKLSDDQAKATLQWMERQNIDNLCKGEERLHKLCMEIRKCVEQSTNNENSTIWSNTLFARDGSIRQSATLQKRPTLMSGFYSNTVQPHYLSLSTQMRSNETLSSAPHTLSSVSSRDFLDSRSPTLTNKSSMPFWSPAMTEADSPSSATSVISSQTQAVQDHFMSKHQTTNALASDQHALERLRQRVTSLLLSDLTSILFRDGSETDNAYWAGLGLELTERHFRTLHPLHSSIGSQTPTADSCSVLKPSIIRFGFETAFEVLLQKFSVNSNPSTKLSCIYDIDKLLVPYMIEQGNRGSPSASFSRHASGDDQTGPDVDAQNTNETSVTGFRSIFSKSSLRPSTIFRDLQYIATLLPSATLQETPQGKAFTNAAVAITSLKNEVRGIMVETADSIINYHSNNRGHGRSSSTAQQQRDSATFSAPSRTPSAEDIARYSMSDAAYLYQIAAKEGDIVAQRELATLYLTHPELMEHIIAPFARPRDVFKEELEGKWRKNQDPNRCDPATMCVAHHWMSLSAKGGDSLAKEYLRQREEMDSF